MEEQVAGFYKSEAGKMMSVIVLSSDGYSDVWPVFFSLFHKHWPDCPYPIYLCCSNASYPSDKVAILRSGLDPGNDWSSRVKSSIVKLKTEYMLVLLEDFFLHDTVDSHEIQNMLSFCIRAQAEYLRLKPFPRGDVKVAPGIRRISERRLHRVALQAAIWNRQSLIGILKEGESPWEFEIRGSIRSDGHYSYFCTENALIPYIQGVERGVWSRVAITQLENMGIKLDLGKRRAMTLWEHALWRFSSLKGELFRLTPGRWQLPLLRLKTQLAHLLR